jgi:hypothetical protein
MNGKIDAILILSKASERTAGNHLQFDATTQTFQDFNDDSRPPARDRADLE